MAHLVGMDCVRADKPSYRKGREALIIWRKLTGEPEQDDLENLETPDDLWKARLIEEDFHRLMFETEGV